MARRTEKIEWQSLPGESGIYVRDYGKEKAYRLQGSHNGKRIYDTLGVMPIEQVRMIRETLKYNRKQGVPPFTYAEMIGSQVAEEKAERIVKEKETKAILKAEDKRQHNTVSRFWEGKYWPHRLDLKRSQRETESIDGRWRLHIKPHFGEFPLEDLTKKHFSDFVKWMRGRTQVLQVKEKYREINPETGRQKAFFRLVEKDTGEAYTETTIHKCLADMRTMWNFAVDEEVVSKTFPGKPVIKEVLAEVDNEKFCYLEPDEAKALAKTVFERRLRSRLDHDTYCYTVLGLCLGLRAGDIHKINRQVIERHVIERTKNKRARFVHFGFRPVRAMLAERLDKYPPADPLEPLFLTGSTDSKGNMRTEVPGRYFEIIKELGFNETARRIGNPMERIDFHALRHTFATFAAIAGTDQITLKKLMGHKKLEMTLRYIEIADAHQAEHLEKALPALFPTQQEHESLT